MRCPQQSSRWGSRKSWGVVVTLFALGVFFNSTLHLSAKRKSLKMFEFACPTGPSSPLMFFLVRQLSEHSKAQIVLFHQLELQLPL